MSEIPRAYIRGRLEVHRQLLGEVQGYWRQMDHDPHLSVEERALVEDLLQGLDKAALAMSTLNPMLGRPKKEPR